MIGIICAMAVEVEGLKSMMDNRLDLDYAKIKFTMGTIEGKDVVAAECGVGKVNAAMCAQLMIDKFNPDLIINSGVAGALTDDLTICDMVVGTEVLQHDMNASALGDPIGEIDFPDAKRIYFPCDEKIAEKIFKLCESIEDANAFKGRIASGDLFVSRRSKRVRINIRFDAIACEMEGGAIGHVCFRNGVPFCVFRVISDDLNKSQGMDFKDFCGIASRRSVLVISDFIKSL